MRFQDLRAENKELKADNQRLDALIRDLGAENKELKAESKELKVDNEGLKADNQRLNVRVSNMHQGLEEIRRVSSQIPMIVCLLNRLAVVCCFDCPDPYSRAFGSIEREDSWAIPLCFMGRLAR